MSVTAVSDSTYLVISSTSTLGSDKTLSLSGVTGTVLPCAYTSTEIKNAAADATLVAANKWYTATGTATNNGAAVVDTKTQLDISEASNLGSVTASSKNYYVFAEFYIGLATGSSPVTQGIQADVTFAAGTSSEFNKCLTVLLDYGDNGMDESFNYNAATGSVTKHSSALQSTSLITTTATKVKVYAYFDGEHASCTTANAINLDGITIGISFTVNEALHTA